MSAVKWNQVPDIMKETEPPNIGHLDDDNCMK